MAKKNTSITFTVFAGYFLLAVLGGLAMWFIYGQVINYTTMTSRSNSSNEKLLLVGEAATKLYEAESLSRQLIQNENLEGLDTYTAKIDSIKSTLASLQDFQEDSSLDREIDSINLLLSQKSANLEELLQLRAKGETESYYSRALDELRRANETFEEPNYEQRFKDLEPHQRRLLVRLLEFAETENPEPANVTVDSLVTSVKTVLNELEIEERQYRIALRNQENQLLSNEFELNRRLRLLLSTLEAEERLNSIDQVSSWQETVEETSQVIAFLGAASLLVILIFVFLVLRDVSKSQRYRKDLENAKSYAESLLKSREQFMNTVTHDLRSPLNSVVGYTGLLQKTNLNKSQNRYLHQLKKSSDYLLHLVNDLLDLSRLEAGKMSIDELAFNPKNLIEETVENAVPPEKPKEVRVHVKISEDLDQAVITDPFRIKQILTNLVSNACKFTEKGRVEINGWLEGEANNRILRIQVKDTGIGISDEQKEKVFEEFSQEDRSIENRYGGTGLGLAISKKLTDLLKGKISLESEPGKGSTFLLQVPVKIAGTKSKTAIPEDFQLHKPQDYSVLLVDDDPAQLNLLRELIKSTGMSFQMAKNGKEALEKLRTHTFDLILTDIQMPQMDGMELLKEIRKNEAIEKLPVIALSGQPNMNPADYLKKGFSGSLLKPYPSNKLLQMIEDILRIGIQKQDPPAATSEDDEKNLYTLSEVKTFAGEDQIALNSILTAFMESSKSNLKALELAFQKGDFQKVSTFAHKMLPMFRQLKATQIVAQLHRLETTSPEEIKTVDIKALAHEVNRLLSHLQQEIRD